MQTHTIRNKDKPTPILTLKPAFFAKVLASRPESASLMLTKLKQDIKALVGKTPSLDYDQQQQLLAVTGATGTGRWVSKFSQYPPHLSRLAELFSSGLLSAPTMGAEEVLQAAEDFYAMLERYFETNTASST